VRAGDQDVFASEIGQRLRAGGERGKAGREPACLDAVRRGDRGERQQTFAQHGKGFRAGEHVAARRSEHRIEHHRPLRVLAEHVGDGVRDRGGAEHAELERGDGNIGEHRARLRRHQLGVERVQAVHAARVLHRERRHGAHRIGAHRGDSEQIGLHAGAARRVGGGEGEHGRRRKRHGLICRPILLAAAMTTENQVQYRTWMCLICGFVYDEAAGLPDEGIAPGTRWEDVPMNWTCPECGARKEDFEMVEI
jgi:rubredoxin